VPGAALQLLIKHQELAAPAEIKKLVERVAPAQLKVVVAAVRAALDLAGTVALESSPIFPALHSSMAVAVHQWDMDLLQFMEQRQAVVEFQQPTAQM
jgi:adenine/guanine phosphoribosyltransferase-like PRPP-binding protein